MAERSTTEESGCLGIDELDGGCTGILASRLHQRIREDEGGIGTSLDANAQGVDRTKVS